MRRANCSVWLWRTVSPLRPASRGHGHRGNEVARADSKHALLEVMQSEMRLATGAGSWEGARPPLRGMRSDGGLLPRRTSRRRRRTRSPKPRLSKSTRDACKSAAGPACLSRTCLPTAIVSFPLFGHRCRSKTRMLMRGLEPPRSASRDGCGVDGRGGASQVRCGPAGKRADHASAHSPRGSHHASSS
jgi:hypothetical protein